MLRFVGVDPVFGATESHVNPAGFVTAFATKANDVVRSVLVAETLSWINPVAPVTTVLLITAGLTLINGVVLTFSVTGNVSGGELEPVADSVTVPLQVPGDKPDVLTATT